MHLISKYLAIGAFTITVLCTGKSHAINSQELSQLSQKSTPGFFGSSARAVFCAAGAAGSLWWADQFWRYNLVCDVAQKINPEYFKCTDIAVGNVVLAAFCFVVASDYAGSSARHIVNMFDSLDRVLTKVRQ